MVGVLGMQPLLVVMIVRSVFAMLVPPMKAERSHLQDYTKPGRCFFRFDVE
jgi:hypothetical protein